MCTNTELQKQIEVVRKKTDGNCKLLEDHGTKLDEISDKIDTWTPYIQKELKRSNAYQIVADDLKSKGLGWKFWLGFLAIILSVVATILVISEKIHLIR